MTTIVNTIKINADPGEVWAVLADLTATRVWLPGVVDARMEGTVRVCTMVDGQEIHEQIGELSAGDRTYSFEHLRTALPVRGLSGTFTVTPGEAAGTADVTLRTSIEPLDPAAGEVTAMIETAFGQSLASLRRYIEEKLTWDDPGR